MLEAVCFVTLLSGVANLLLCSLHDLQLLFSVGENFTIVREISYHVKQAFSV
jgi:hypothetical protein